MGKEPWSPFIPAPAPQKRSAREKAAHERESVREREREEMRHQPVPQGQDVEGEPPLHSAANGRQRMLP